MPCEKSLLTQQSRISNHSTEHLLFLLKLRKTWEVLASR